MMLPIYIVSSSDFIEVPNKNTFEIFYLTTDNTFYAKLNIDGIISIVTLGSGSFDVNSLVFVPLTTPVILTSNATILGSVNLTYDLYYQLMFANNLTNLGTLMIIRADKLTTIEMTALSTVISIVIEDNVVLSSILIAALETANSVTIQNNNSISTLDISCLETVHGGVFISDNVNLTSITIPASVNWGINVAQIKFNSNALDTATIDAILAAIDAGGEINNTLNISGGTNAAPTGGNANANRLSLIGKGWTVINN